MHCLGIPVTFSKGEDVESAFSRLSNAVTTSIKGNNFSSLQRATIEKAKSQRFLKSHELLPLIAAQESFENLCTILAQTSYWNFLDTRMIEALVNASGIPALQESLENFKKTFFGMTLEKAAPYFPVEVCAKPGHTMIEEVLDRDPKKMTIYELHKHRFYLESELFQTGSDTCTICKIVIGSVTIIWQIHVDHVYHAYLALNKKESQLPSHAITHLSISEVLRWIGQPILWRGQEVDQIGPIKKAHHIRPEPYPLPDWLKWADLSSENIGEISTLYDDNIRILSMKYLQWCMLQPKSKSSLHFGIRKCSTNELYTFCIFLCSIPYLY